MKKIEQEQATIVTHNGPFHADDVVGVAVVKEFFSGKVEILRTRDEVIVDDADFVVDVGGEHHPHRGEFDHHQWKPSKGEGAIRENGIPYASAGLVWSAYGHIFIRNILEQDMPDEDGITLAHIDEAMELVDANFIAGVDAQDTGTSGFESPKGVKSFGALVSTMNPTFLEQRKGASFDEKFEEAVDLALDALRREVHNALSVVVARDTFKFAEVKLGGRVKVLEQYVPWTELEVPEEVTYVAFPGPDNAGWRLQQVPEEVGSFEGRKPLPEAWAGLRGEDFQEEVGLDEVGSSTFCHPGRFIAGCETREDVLKMAEQALEA